MACVRASVLTVTLFALVGCGGTEAEDVVDARADTRVDGDAPTCGLGICSFDPNKPPMHNCCTEACIGAPCDGGQPSCVLPCSPSGFYGQLYCSDGVWTAGLGLFPCGGDAGADADADAPTCSIGDALVSDASCSAGDAGCGAGEICAVEIGGPMKRGAAWCVTIPPECGGTPTCACMGVCACGTWRCVDGTASGEIFCDDGTI